MGHGWWPNSMKYNDCRFIGQQWMSGSPAIDMYTNATWTSNLAYETVLTETLIQHKQFKKII